MSGRIKIKKGWALMIWNTIDKKDKSAIIYSDKINPID